MDIECYFSGNSLRYYLNSLICVFTKLRNFEIKLSAFALSNTYGNFSWAKNAQLTHINTHTHK